ncbi:hypothetical protein CAPTEDRAFT_213518 [Capitella teleta]|uniref:Uncharacterized protein n=1 Tax=Capitella teleta TaxID=283909 RepID=R7V8M1_CAPTE|nr:hypothetical protein CAPTEDRAFT_213518 [Capitella teleta]|eukprot:ELU15168.1 hypothetical protein CAPTEDRAFT_213518 [Capitella teleta]
MRTPRRARDFSRGEKTYVTASTRKQRLKPGAREGDLVWGLEFGVWSLQEWTGEVTQEATDGTVISWEVQDERTGNPLRKRRRGTSQDAAATKRRVVERYRVLDGGYRVQSKNQ